MNAQKPDALRLADALAYCDSSVASQAARELRRLYAENAALQQGYDAALLEIDHLRGATKMMEPAQPVAWLVYLPSIDTQNVYDSQDDPGYVDDVTNHADAEVTPLYEMAAPKAEVAPAGEYPAITTEFINKHAHPSQAAKICRADWSGKDESSVETVHPEVIKLLHAYVDADRAMRASRGQAPAPAAVAGPVDDLAELSLLNRLIDLGNKAAGAHAASNSDDGHKGTAAYVQWQELRSQMGDLIRAAYAEPTTRAAPKSAPVAQGDAEQLLRQDDES